MRDALSMLDRAAAAGAVDEQTVTTALGVMGQDDGVHLAEHFKAGDLAAAVTLLEEYYNAGRDLAAVFDQMLGLIRDALLVKTSRTDVSALISPAYTVKTLQALCDGLAASTLIAWSRIIGDSLDRMRSAAAWKRSKKSSKTAFRCRWCRRRRSAARRLRRGTRTRPLRRAMKTRRPR